MTIDTVKDREILEAMSDYKFSKDYRAVCKYEFRFKPQYLQEYITAVEERDALKEGIKEVVLEAKRSMGNRKAKELIGELEQLLSQK